MSNLVLSRTIEDTIYALSIVFYGMLAVWAAGSQWHWFLRAAVVGAALTALVVLPAYQHAILVAIASIFFAFGLTYWRRKRSRTHEPDDTPPSKTTWPRLSLRDVLLIVAIAAIGLSVAVHAPKYNVYSWLFTFVDAAVLAMMGLACVWLALGRAPLVVRLAAAPLIVAINIFLVHAWLIWFSFGLTSFFTTYTTTFQAHWEDRAPRYLTVNVPMTLADWSIAVTIATGAFVAWLATTRAAGWFDSVQTQSNSAAAEQGAARRRFVAKTLAVLSTAAIAALPLYVWLQLITPHPLPADAFASDQNYKELLAVADELYEVYGGNHNAWSSQVSDAQIRKLIANDEPQWRRLQKVIAEGCRFPWQLVKDEKRNEPMAFLAYLMYKRVERGDGTGTIEPRIAAAMDMVRLQEMERRASSIYFGEIMNGPNVEDDLWNLRSQMNAQQCRDIARFLAEVEQQREPPAEFATRSRRILQNAAWNSHLENINQELANWLYPQDTRVRRRMLIDRMLIVELGIRAFELDRGHLPKSLDELVPDFLSALPEDPYGPGPFIYMRSGGIYLLYSVGPNGVDERGDYAINANYRFLRDIPSSEMFQQTRPAPASTPPAASGEEATDESTTGTKRE